MTLFLGIDMGASASKPGRKLASSIEKDVSSAVLAGRKGNVNTLPSQALKDKYAEHSIEKQLKETELEPEVDHLPLRSESFRNAPKFDASKLTKKLQKKSQAQDNLLRGKMDMIHKSMKVIATTLQSRL